MQKFLSVPIQSGRQLMACLKNMARMDIAERRASQDGKILRIFENAKLEFAIFVEETRLNRSKPRLPRSQIDNFILNLPKDIGNSIFRFRANCSYSAAFTSIPSPQRVCMSFI